LSIEVFGMIDSTRFDVHAAPPQSIEIRPRQLD
jgi:hypothetical protein